MTELIYQIDSYARTFEATITALEADQNGIYLDRTVFYPGGGGQPADSGTLTIDGTPYTVKKAARGNIHILDGDLPETAVIGANVQGEIDWEKRYQLMRTHTAMHILCGVVWRDYGASVTGSNMEPLKGRMDFEFEQMEKSLVTEIEAAINEAAKAGREVKTNILPREEAFQIPDLIRTKINLLPESITEVRTVELTGLDLQACGGTHLANTAEIGPISVTNYKSKGGINKRIYFELDEAT